VAESRPEGTMQADSANGRPGEDLRAGDRSSAQNDQRSDTSSNQKDPSSEDTELNHEVPRTRKRFFIIGAVVLVLLGVALYWWHSTYYESTDDAQIDGNLVQISARVKGYISKVNVEDNQQVEQGQVLVEIDPRDAQAALDQGEAELATAKANYAGKCAHHQHVDRRNLEFDSGRDSGCLVDDCSVGKAAGRSPGPIAIGTGR
jgi:Biotin-lipoyl like